MVTHRRGHFGNWMKIEVWMEAGGLILALIIDFRLSPCVEYLYFGYGVLHGAHSVKPQNQSITKSWLLHTILKNTPYILF